MSAKEEIFAEAANSWDLKKLYEALEAIKRQVSPRARRGLTQTEKLYLRGLLCGYSPSEIARQLFQSSKGVEVYLCKTLYPYFRKLLDIPQEATGNWRNICQQLENAGFKSQASSQNQYNNGLPQETLVKIVNVDCLKSNTISIDINVRLSFPSVPDHQDIEEIGQDNY